MFDNWTILYLTSMNEITNEQGNAEDVNVFKYLMTTSPVYFLLGVYLCGINDLQTVQ
jgi:hypothetical protein